MAAARVIPGVWGVFVSTSPACTIFTPCCFQSNVLFPQVRRYVGVSQYRVSDARLWGEDRGVTQLPFGPETAMSASMERFRQLSDCHPDAYRGSESAELAKDRTPSLFSPRSIPSQFLSTSHQFEEY